MIKSPFFYKKLKSKLRYFLIYKTIVYTTFQNKPNHK